MVKPSEHLLRGRKKRNILSFRLELAEELIGSFCSRQRVGGHPRSAEHLLLDRLNSKKGNCYVCMASIRSQGLPTVGNRHESRIQCEHCRVYLCITAERNCLKNYHTLVNL